jgi:fructokinase
VPADASAIQLGSYAMVVEPAASTLCALVERAQGRLPVAWDINMRLNVEPALARWRERLAWMRPRAQLVKLSDEDLARLEPEAARSDAALDAMAAAWLADGVRLVVLTRGAQGATAWHARAGRVQVPPVPTALVDTVGAGDTFQAAMLAALAERGRLSLEGLAALDERTLGEVLGFATRAAAITCSRRGADLPRRAELG